MQAYLRDIRIYRRYIIIIIITFYSCSNTHTTNGMKNLIKWYMKLKNTVQCKQVSLKTGNYIIVCIMPLTDNYV